MSGPQQPWGPQGPWQQHPSYAPQPQPQYADKGYAVGVACVALVVHLAGLFGLGLAGGIVAVVMGVKSLRRGGPRAPQGLPITGIVLGSIAIGVGAIAALINLVTAVSS